MTYKQCIAIMATLLGDRGTIEWTVKHARSIWEEVEYQVDILAKEEE
jgi:hypothetical protein